MAERKLRRSTICWIAAGCLLLLGAACWLVYGPRTAFVVTINEIRVDSSGRVRIEFTFEARRDAALFHGWREPGDEAHEDVDVVTSGRRIGFLERWQSGIQDSVSMEFTTPHPESVQVLARQGERLHLAPGERIPLMRVDRENDGHIVRLESFLGARDEPLDPGPETSSIVPDGDH